MGEKMNQYLYIPLLIWLPILSLVTPANSANLKYSENKPLISRKDEPNLSWEQPDQLNDKLALNDSLNLAKNDNSLLLSLGKNFILVASNNPLCPFLYQVEEQKNPASVSFLPQVKAGDIFKGIYDFDQNEVCQVDNNKQIISRLVSTEEPAIKGEEEPLSKNVYILKSQEFSPRQTNYKYFQTVKELNTNSKRQSFNYQNNYQSLRLSKKSNPIKPISINKNTASPSLKSDQRQNFLKAISPPGTTSNSFQTNKLETSQSPVSSSLILETMKLEREKQLQQTKKQQEQLKQRLIKQAEQRRNNANQKNQSKYPNQTGRRFSY